MTYIPRYSGLSADTLRTMLKSRDTTIDELEAERDELVETVRLSMLLKGFPKNKEVTE